MTDATQERPEPVDDLASASPTADASSERGRIRAVALDTVYVLAGFPLALLRFCILLPLTALGAGLSIIGIGLPILLATLALASAFARFDRAWLVALRGERLPEPKYRVDLRTGVREIADLRTLLHALGDPMRIRELLHGIVSLPLAIATFLGAFGWWSISLAAITTPVTAWFLPEGSVGFGELLDIQSPFLNILLSVALGVVLLLRIAPGMDLLATLNSGLATMLLTRRRVDLLESRVSELSESRDAAVSAESDSLRRLERDLHDGPQQRLVRLAMDLSTVRRRLDSDPDSARPLVDEALQQTQETLDELRALSRGIAPPILTDRGLHAALTAVAARSPVRTEIETDLPEGVRLSQPVENAAYFVCAEALANVAKHSQASRCTISVSRGVGAPSGTLVHVIVTDDGVGGAHVSKGHGIAGLTDRVRALGGRLDLESPSGGPTVLAAAIPSGPTSSSPATSAPATSSPATSGPATGSSIQGGSAPCGS